MKLLLIIALFVTVNGMAQGDADSIPFEEYTFHYDTLPTVEFIVNATFSEELLLLHNEYKEWCNESTQDTVYVEELISRRLSGSIPMYEKMYIIPNGVMGYEANEVEILYHELSGYISYYVIAEKSRCEPTFNGFIKWMKQKEVK